MLLNFRIANFRAFRDPQELTMKRARSLKTFEDSCDWNSETSAIAVIYGPNASGKSTLFKAFEFVGKAVRNSYRRWSVDGGVEGVAPFLLDRKSLDRSSEFEIEFIGKDGVRYQYGFQASIKRVEAEWLYFYKKSNRSILFERNIEDDEPLYFGATFRGNRVAIMDALASRDNALFLSVAAQLGNKSISHAYHWIVEHLRTYDAREYKSELRHLSKLLREDEGAKDRLSQVLAKADLGISSLTVAENEVDPVMLERAYEAFKLLSADEFEAVDENELNRAIDAASYEVQFLHRGSGKDVAFPLGWESDGTQALLSFASVAMKALRTGSTMIVDEIDSSLHPTIVAELVRAFRHPKTNPRQAQLIVTTHDATLLGVDTNKGTLLDRDQVWVTEKGIDGASGLVAISEYRTPRKEENLMRGYLMGRYGGVPMPAVFDAICSIQEDD